MNKYCPKCGFQNPDASKFCAKCGATLKEKKDISGQQVQQPVQQPGGYTPPTSQPSQVPKTSNKMILGLAIVAIILSAAALSSAFLITPESTISSSSVGRDELKDNSVTSNKIVDDTITDDDISDNTIKSNHIIDNSITFQDLAADVYEKIVNQTFISEDIANDSITSSKIKNLTIATNDLANNSVTSEKIKDGEISSSDIADGSVSSDDIATDAVDSAEIAAGAVETNELKNNAVTYDKMAMKIKYGKATNKYNGSSISHDIGSTPAYVILTPEYSSDYANATISANVISVGANSFTITLYAIYVDGTVSPIPSGTPVDVYWIAIYSA